MAYVVMEGGTHSNGDGDHNVLCCLMTCFLAALDVINIHNMFIPSIIILLLLLWL